MDKKNIPDFIFRIHKKLKDVAENITYCRIDNQEKIRDLLDVIESADEHIDNIENIIDECITEIEIYINKEKI